MSQFRAQSTDSFDCERAARLLTGGSVRVRLPPMSSAVASQTDRRMPSAHVTEHHGGRIELAALCKQFADVVAVDEIDLTIEPGEFFSLLGPSGCGKTTTLRMIAGFERPSGGHILLDGKDVSGTPPNR